MLQSRNRVLQDVERWQSSGWITDAGATAIRADLASRRSGLGLAHVLGVLAAVMIGCAVLSFVAANWQSVPRVARLAIIFGGLIASLGAAGVLRMKNHPRFADAAMLIAVIVFGAGIMLIAQMYQMDGHPPDAVWLWGVGALAAGLLTASRPTLGAALVLFVIWHVMEQSFNWRPGVHVAFLPALAGVAFGVAITRWNAGAHLVCLALAGWIVEAGYVFNGGTTSSHLVVVLIGCMIAGLSVGVGSIVDHGRKISGPMLIYGVGIAFAGALAVQHLADARQVWFYGACILAALFAVLTWSWRTDNRPALWVAYAALSIEIVTLYVMKVGSLLGTAAFFLIAGLAVAGLAFVAVRLHRATADQGAHTA